MVFGKIPKHLETKQHTNNAQEEEQTQAYSKIFGTIGENPRGVDRKTSENVIINWDTLILWSYIPGIQEGKTLDSKKLSNGE